MKLASPERLAQIVFFVLLAAATVYGARLRLPALDLRPMHVDEAIQAARFGQLLEEGTFDYLPEDGHGPGLLYATLPFAKALGVSSYRETDESFLRSVPAWFGIAMISLTGIAFSRWLGKPAGIASAFLVAASPLMNFYSRYYIMEVPMVFFLLLFIICAWRYVLTRRLPWLIAAGLCGAAMHATKETFGISVVALVVGSVAAALVSLRYQSWQGSWLRGRLAEPSRLAIHLSIALPISLVASAALYSVFFRDPQSIAESYQTYANYLARGTGETGHEKPWHYYLGLLFEKQMEARFSWSEALTLFLATLGAVASFAWPKLAPERRFLALTLTFYTLFSFLFYSLIPYKTPWSIMSSLHAATLLAGIGFYATLRLCKHPVLQLAACIPFVFGVRDLARQAHDSTQPYRGKMPLYAMESRNPYVYGHTTTGFVNNLVEPMRELLAVSDEGERTVIRIIHPESAWPIPWYFRQYEFNFFPEFRSVERDPIIITDFVDEMTLESQSQLLGEEYSYQLANLRSDVVVAMFYKKELFDRVHPDL